MLFQTVSENDNACPGETFSITHVQNVLVCKKVDFELTSNSSTNPVFELDFNSTCFSCTWMLPFAQL